MLFFLSFWYFMLSYYIYVNMHEMFFFADDIF